ncbi:MAG: UDP-N-acetylmuramate dehydrogenase [Caulobacterales bacterium]
MSLSALPAARGQILRDTALAPYTWFRVGGPADALFLPEDEADLSQFLQALPAHIPVTPLGVGSNLIVRDGGVRGVCVRLGRGFAGIEPRGDSTIFAGAAALDAQVAIAAGKAGISGLEFYRGVPGTIGGALTMNAGAYGGETKDVLIEAYAQNREGQRVTISNAEMGFSYRTCLAAEGLIFTGALYRGRPGDPEEIAARMKEIMEKRENSQPIRDKTGGSTFRNPDPATSGGRGAWQMIDAAGLRGHRRGGAQISEKHCNFLINTGDATAADIEGLGEEARAKVLQDFGVDLHWEIKRIGEV